jgi:hypothetical protein
MKVLDRAILDVYSTFPLPPDQIVCAPAASERFASLVNPRLPYGQQVTVEIVSKRLLNLRRKGQDKGGLPRRWRSYYGRDN